MSSKYKLYAAMAIVLCVSIFPSCAFNQEHSFETYTAEGELEYNRQLQYQKMKEQMEINDIVTKMKTEQEKQDEKKAKKNQ